MSERNSRISISTQGWSIEVEGAESFVERQIEAQRRFFEGVGPNGGPTVEVASGPSGREAFENVLAVHDDRIHILKGLPGDTRADKMVSGALILAFANERRGNPAISFDEVRDLCVAHGCLDSSNLSKVLKAEREAFVFGGTQRKQTLALTVPGRRRASELLKELNELPAV